MKQTYSSNPSENTEAADKSLKVRDEKVEDVEMTEEQTRGQLLSYENDILSALINAANFREDTDEITQIDIERGGKKILTFHIHPLDEEEYNACREKNTRYVRNKNVGVKIPEKTNAARYRSCLIYEATIPEDREKIWDNKDAWKALNVLNGPDLISKVLKAGEKDAVCEKLDEISGYTATEIETIKN